MQTREIIYNLIKERTLNKYQDGKQVKITSREIRDELSELSSNIIFVQLKKLSKYLEVQKEVNKIRRPRKRDGKKMIIGITVSEYWIKE